MGETSYMDDNKYDEYKYLNPREYLIYRKNRKPGEPYFPEGTIHKDEYFDVGSLHFFWDGAKNEANRLVHGIDFHTAAYVFNDIDKLVDENDFIDGEQRMTITGEPTDPVVSGYPIDTAHSKPKAILGRVEGIVIVVYVEFTSITQGEIIDPYDFDNDNEREILIISARPAYPDEAQAYIDMLSV